MIETRPAARALMACLGEHSRFRIVQALMSGPRCVTDLAAEVGLSQSCTTRHLQALERRNVVRGTRDGKRVLYRIRDDQPDLRPLLGWALQKRAAAGAGAAPLGASKGASASKGGPHGVSRIRRRARVAPEPARSPEVREAMARPAAPPATAPSPAPALELDPPRAGPRRSSSDMEDFLL
jgi:ArsR family transcriptional regulator